MTLGQSIYDTLIANTALAALVGESIFPVQVKQGQEMPYIVWQKIAAEPWTTHNEQTTEADSANRVQFTIVADDYDELEAIEAALIAALDNVQVLPGHPASYEDSNDLPSDLPGTYARATDFTF